MVVVLRFFLSTARRNNIREAGFNSAVRTSTHARYRMYPANKVRTNIAKIRWSFEAPRKTIPLMWRCAVRIECNLLHVVRSGCFFCVWLMRPGRDMIDKKQSRFESLCLHYSIATGTACVRFVYGAIRVLGRRAIDLNVSRANYVSVERCWSTSLVWLHHFVINLYGCSPRST